jgi:hypothetical protein
MDRNIRPWLKCIRNSPLKLDRDFIPATHILRLQATKLPGTESAAYLNV